MSTNTELKELIDFIHHPNPELRRLAIKGLLPFTVKNSSNNLRKLVEVHEKLIEGLKNSIRSDQNQLTGHDSLSALINLTDQDLLIEKVSDLEFLKFLIQRVILDPKSILADLGCMLLSNLTKSEKVIKDLFLIDLKGFIDLVFKTSSSDSFWISKDSLDDDQRFRSMDLLVEVFCKSDRFNQNSNFDFLASVWANFSSCQMGRDYLIGLDKEPRLSTQSPLFQLLPFTQHTSLIRRGGVISCVKNCCFSTEVHQKFLDPNQFNILPSILLPLIGPEQFDEFPEDELEFPVECQFINHQEKLREKDSNLRLILIEGLILLASLNPQRQYLRDKKVYRIVQVLHLNEPDEKVQEAVERLVNLLMRDESDEIIQSNQKQIELVEEDEAQLVEV